MRRLASLFALVLFLFAMTGEGARAGDIVVSDAYARLSPSGSGGAFMLIRNKGAADRLVSVTAPVADKAELHVTKMDDGVMRMQAVDAVDVPENGMTALEPGGTHIMLFGVPRGLKPGDAVDLTLRFENAGDVAVSAEIHSPGSTHQKEGHSH